MNMNELNVRLQAVLDQQHAIRSRVFAGLEFLGGSRPKSDSADKPADPGQPGALGVALTLVGHIYDTQQQTLEYLERVEGLLTGEKDGSTQSCANVPVNALLGRACHLAAWPTPTVGNATGDPRFAEERRCYQTSDGPFLAGERGLGAGPRSHI